MSLTRTTAAAGGGGDDLVAERSKVDDGNPARSCSGASRASQGAECADGVNSQGPPGAWGLGKIAGDPTSRLLTDPRLKRLRLTKVSKPVLG
jgi:hypothetical protein